MEMPSRIAYLSSAQIPSNTANSIHVMKMCQALARAGHEVVLFAPDKGNRINVSDHDPYEYYGVEPIFKICYSLRRGRKGSGTLYRWRCAWRVKRMGVNLVIGRGLASCCLASWLGVSTIYETHAPVEDDGVISRVLFAFLIRAPAFKCLVLITDALRRHFEQAWPTLKGRTVVAPDGADRLSDCVKPIELAGTGERMQVGYTGHLYQGKGAELVVELAQVCPHFDFHIVGGTESDLQRLKKSHNIPDNLTLHGHQPHEQISSYVLAFDAVLLPNQPVVNLCSGTRDIGRWTSPLKLFEYMAAGRAIICSDVPVLQEVAEDGVNMLVCRYDNVSDWVSALERLASDQALRVSLGRTAREQLISRYSWDVRAGKLLSLR